MINFAKKVSSIKRTLIGRGFDECLMFIKKMHNDMKIYKIKSSTKVFDWIIPNEWLVKKAYFSDEKKKIL